MKYAGLSATVSDVKQHMVRTDKQHACRSVQIVFFFPSISSLFDHDFPVNNKQYVTFLQSCDAFSYLAAE